MTHQYKKLPVTMKIWMQFNVMPRTQQVKEVKQKINNEAQQLYAGIVDAKKLLLGR